MGKLSNDIFIERIIKLTGKDFTFLDEYDGAETKIRVRHNICGNIHMVTPHAFTKGPSCPECSVKKKKLTNGDFINRVVAQVGSEYMFLEDYVNMRTKLNVIHMKCDTRYKVNPHMFLKGTRCPDCNFSKGESYISNFLKQNNIEYESQFRFSDCKHKYTLPFDFALSDDTGIYAVIEYHGKQHYQINEFFGGEDGFKSLQKRDAIKERYCNENNIIYVEIPYILTSDQIEETIFRVIFRQVGQKIGPRAKVGVAGG